MAWLADQASFCPRCGTRPEDWMSGGRVLDPAPFRVGRQRCCGCERLDAADKELGDHDAALTGGVSNVLVPNEAFTEAAAL